MDMREESSLSCANTRSATYNEDSIEGLLSTFMVPTGGKRLSKSESLGAISVQFMAGAISCEEITNREFGRSSQGLDHIGMLSKLA